VKCYTHRGSDAVGVCKNCGRGLCGGCARDLEQGLACSDTCASKLSVLEKKPARSFAPPSFDAVAAREPPPRAETPHAPPPPKAIRRFEPPNYDAVKVRGAFVASPVGRARAWSAGPAKYVLMASAAVGLVALGALAMG
jgi:predicted Fe-S protein YdhL (DUF1289 family)